MSEPREDSTIRGKDTSPLKLTQLSDEELATIREIELRLYEAQAVAPPGNPLDPRHYLQRSQKRDPRVLLLDGGRGTGKTSLLLTMAKWWNGGFHQEPNQKDLQRERATRLNKIPRLRRHLGTNPAENNGFAIPHHVQVLRIIDFDPLPVEMPLMAGLVQAWKPLAVHYDYRSGNEHPDGLLMDKWHGLFQVAAVGWTPIPNGKGLIEQILDREEQVKDWSDISDNWQSFVGDVITRGKKFKEPDKYPSEPVFVIMIDDVDLQVERIRELLPALRMLYHPRVFFIVAADRRHMVSMLELDFLGQQNRLGKRAKYHDQALLGKFDEWPDTLARAAFQKVFAPTNIWPLKQLTLRDLLIFPKDEAEQNIKGALNAWGSQNTKLRSYKQLGDYKLGDYLYWLDRVGRPFKTAEAQAASEDGVAGHEDQETSGDELDLPPIMSYRRAHQLSEMVKSPPTSRDTALELMGQIVEGADSSNSKIRLSADPDGADGYLEYLATGELGAIFPKVYGVELSSGREIVLSGRPKFFFRDGLGKELARRPDEQSDIWPHLLAASLRHDGFGVVASGLRPWNVYLALAWTHVPLPEWEGRGLDLAFWWRVHELPSPLQFVAWARDWARFIRKLSERSEDSIGDQANSSQREWIAYAYVYHQLRWMTKDQAKFSKVRHPLNDNTALATEDWKNLLSLTPDQDDGTWRTRTLPLLARPELFLPPNLQGYFLEHVTSAKSAGDLQTERKRLITDAIAAARYPKTGETERAEGPKGIETLVRHLDTQYREFYGEPSPWLKKVGTNSKKTAVAVKTNANTMS